MAIPTSIPCHICSGSLREWDAYGSLARVTSDCKAWPAGGRLGACLRCGTVQKVVDDRWQDEIERIYAAYTIYFQAGGAEQTVFVGNGAPPVLRSDRLVAELTRHAVLPAQGRLLDVGCGNGAFLRAFSAARSDWTLRGTELSDTNRSVIEAIPGVEALHTGALEDTPGLFSLISLIHVLEHIRDPRALLATVATKLAPGGVLFVEVPNAARNPFDLLIADHATHFTPESVTALLEDAGFAVTMCSTDWVTKEISLIGTRADGQTEAVRRPSPDAGFGLEWLLRVRDAARRAQTEAAARPFGIFGSSIAATWLAQEVGGAMAFFADEDPARRGGTFMGRPILTPSEVPDGAVVFVGIGGGTAADIASRLVRERPSVTWIPSPPLA